MPKKHRLSNEVFTHRAPGKRLHGRLFSLSVSPLPAGVVRIACVVSKKVAPKAHDRNLLKRRCREVLRAHLKTLKRPYALVVQAKQQAHGASFAQIREDIVNLLHPMR